MFPLRVKLAALLALAALLLPATSLGRVLTLCKMSGRLGETCCCHGSGHREALKVGKLDVQRAKAKRPGCCEQRLTRATQILTSQPEVDVPVVQAVLIAELTLPELSEPHAGTVSLRPMARGPPPLGPPLYIRHCSLLN
ncbi:MAG: hypothetical protein R3B89_15260 [Polyangiaceae bacterium]